MRLTTSFEEDGPLVSAALLAAQATEQGDGFRQKDVRFFVELFSNWLESAVEDAPLAVHNTQISRCLLGLASASWVRRRGRKPPRWSLTGEGVIGLLRRLAYRGPRLRLDEFFLVYHFLDVYGPRLQAMGDRGGVLAAAPGLAQELAAWTDPARWVQQERARTARVRENLRRRADESLAAAALAEYHLKSGQSLGEVVSMVQARFPYDLNNQKSLQDLLGVLPEGWRREELTSTSRRRATGLWQQLEALLAAYEGVLSLLPVDSGPV